MGLTASTPERRLYHLITLLFMAGLILTVLSYARICTSACAAVHQYKMFGWDFEILGLAFFIGVGTLHILSWGRPALELIAALSVAGAIGAEVNLILVQNYVIGQWCLVCLSIAGVIALIAFCYLVRFAAKIDRLNWSLFMKSFSTLVALLLGFSLSFVGVFKPEKSFAEGIGQDEVPYFGNADSNVEVYIVTDWFCPACQKVDPILEPLYPRIMKKARLYFIDYPIHPESMNYVPYNLSFMIRDKQEYFKIRKALHRLAKKTKSPTQVQVEEAVKPYGVEYKPLNFMDINEGVKFMENIVRNFKVKVTPTVVVANRKKLDAKKITGADIDKETIFEAIDEMESQ
ncbi:MAG: thioredoxin domain-containing protein [Chlamydiia bacterium]|nr:thioredoxin domain-containing protein [Chlamydiia bacterium]